MISSLSHSGKVLLAAASLACAAVSAEAQIVELRGVVTRSDPGMAGTAPIGESVVFRIDFSAMSDELPETPQVGLFCGVPFLLEIGGRALPVASENMVLRVNDDLGGVVSGLCTEADWIPEESPPVVICSLLTAAPIMTSDHGVPEIVAMDAFHTNEARYRTAAGSVEWIFVSYTVVKEDTPQARVSPPGPMGGLENGIGRLVQPIRPDFSTGFSSSDERNREAPAFPALRRPQFEMVIRRSAPAIAFPLEIGRAGSSPEEILGINEGFAADLY